MLRWPTWDVPVGRPVADVAGATVAGRLEHPVTLGLATGDRLVVTGENGAGKSTLLALLAGALTPTGGTVHHRPDVRVAHLAQEVPAWDPSRTAREVLEEHAAHAAGLLDPAAVRTPVRCLSQGQQRRLHLAISLARRPDLLLLDEPTNHLSATLVDELTAALATAACAVVVATHDRQLLRDLAGWPTLHLGALREPR